MWSPANVKVCCITGSWILAQNTSILGLRTMNSRGRMYVVDTIISIGVLLRREIVSRDCGDPVSADMFVRGNNETSPILNLVRLRSLVSFTSVLRNCMGSVLQRHITRTHLSVGEWNR